MITLHRHTARTEQYRRGSRARQDGRGYGEDDAGTEREEISAAIADAERAHRDPAEDTLSVVEKARRVLLPVQRIAR